MNNPNSPYFGVRYSLPIILFGIFASIIVMLHVKHDNQEEIQAALAHEASDLTERILDYLNFYELNHQQATALSDALALSDTIVLSDTLADLRVADSKIRFELRDVTDPKHPALLYAAKPTDDKSFAFQYVKQQTVFGRQWQLTLYAPASFSNHLHQIDPIAALVIGILTSALVAGFASASLTSSRRRNELVRQQLHLASIVENSHDAIISKALDGTVTSWNSGAEKLFGYRADETIGHSLLELIVPRDRIREEKDILKRLHRGEIIENFETVRRRRDGSLVSILMTISPTRDAEGKIIGASKIAHDITTRKAYEKKILELNERLGEKAASTSADLNRLNHLFSGVLHAASEISIIATDRDGLITVFNTGAERMLGYSADEMIGKATPALIHVGAEVEARGAELSAQYGQSITGFRVFVHKPEHEGAESREWTYVRKDGSLTTVNLTVTAMRDEHHIVSGYLGIAIDITQQKAAEKQLTETLADSQAMRDQLSLAVEAAELGIWSWDLSEQTLQMNDRMYEFYQLPLSMRKIGVDFEEWRKRLHPDDSVDIEERFNAALQSDQHDFNPTHRVVRPDGSLIYVQSAALIERDANGKATRVTGINRDITVQIQHETALRIAKEKADAANQAKSAFLSNMSHEIRTPMNAILGMLDLVLRTDLNQRQRDYITKSRNASHTLLGLLNDILDFSKIDAGKLELDPHLFSIEQLLNDLTAVLCGNLDNSNIYNNNIYNNSDNNNSENNNPDKNKPDKNKLDNKAVEVIYDIDPTIPNELIGDSLRLRQILINLSSNAAKFTHAGHITIRVTELNRSVDRTQLRFSVIDSGIGISPEQKQTIFDSFSQAEASTSRRYGGTGLGLAICRRLVQLMDAELCVESELGRGSHFWFDLDLRIAATTSQRAEQSAALHLLVIDDNAMAGEVLARVAQKLGWNTRHVTSGAAGIAEVRAAQLNGTPYDAVLIDWQMPELDGISTAKRIREQANGEAPAVILMAAYGQEALLERQLLELQQSGAAPYKNVLTKPCTPQEFAKTVQRALDLSTVDNATYQHHSTQLLKDLHILVVEDNALNREVAAEMLLLEGAEVSLAEDGFAGIAQINSAQPLFDVVIMDMQMPGIDGLETTRRIRADHRFTHLPILAMTANASAADRAACLEAGMNDHIGKPIELAELVAALLRLSGRNSAATPAGAIFPEQENNSALTQTLPAILSRLGNTLDDFKQALPQFKSDALSILEQLHQRGANADIATTKSLLQSFKNIADTIGASTLSAQTHLTEREVDAIKPVDIVVLLSLLQRSCDALQTMIDATEISNTATTSASTTADNDLRSPTLHRSEHTKP